jgi:YbgC/YbaW family acyl-CoA thioester hydrolase
MIPKKGFMKHLFQAKFAPMKPTSKPILKPIEQLVHFDDADPAGIVFFGNYYRLHHRAMEQTLPQWGLTWEDFFRRPGVGFPVRHSEADYTKPIKPGSRIFISVTPERIGTTSITFKSEFRDTADPLAPLIAVVKVTHVCVDVKTLKKTALPEKLVQALHSLSKDDAEQSSL